jgi:D-inositol-3-phosphate glycosyltransferase
MVRESGTIDAIRIDGVYHSSGQFTTTPQTLTGKNSMANGNTTIGIDVMAQARSYDHVRTTSATLVKRAQSALLKMLLPGQTAVRGDWVAVDYLTEAFLRHGRASKYTLFVSPDFLQAAKSAITTSHREKVRTGNIRVTSRADLLNCQDDHQLTTYLAPQGITTTAFLIRSFASNLYPITLVSHGLSGNWQLYDRFLRLLLTPMYSCDSIICTSRASRNAVRAIVEIVGERFNREFHSRLSYSGRLDVIPLCIDTEKFKPREKAPIRKQLSLPKEAVILLFLGRISPVKADLLPLLRVFYSLLQQNRDRRLCLVIAGTRDPLYAQAVEEQVRLLSLSDQVRFMNDLTDEQKLGLLQASDIFVSPADGIEESFGIAPVEAMACGIPQVVSDWNGYRDTVSHGETGFLVPTYWTRADSDLSMTAALLGMEFDSAALGGSVAVDLDSLQSYLQSMVRSDLLRNEMSRRSTQRAHSLFSFPSVVKQYEELWLELCEIAKTLPSHRKQYTIEIPRYFDCFRGHASFVITDDCQLHMTAFGREIGVTELNSLLKVQNLRFNLLDEKLIWAVLKQLRDSTQSSESDAISSDTNTIGGLARIMVQQSGQHPDFVRRHVMWLIKHGLLKPEISAPQART